MGCKNNKKAVRAHHDDFLSLQRFDLSGSALSVAVAVTELPVVSVSPAEHLAALRQRQTVPVRPDRRRELRHHEPCVQRRKLILLQFSSQSSVAHSQVKRAIAGLTSGDI